MQKRYLRTSFFVFMAILSLLAVVIPPTTAIGASLPTGFADHLVATIGAPAGLAFTPDGRLLVIQRRGVVRVIKPGATTSSQALDISAKICNNSERGLTGVVADPNFATNRYIYLYYTFNKHNLCPYADPSNPNNPVNRVSRFVLGDNNLISPSSEVVLIDNIPSMHGNHNAGDLHFGQDGLLYISAGDGGCDYALDSGCADSNNASRDQHVLVGKILRITRDGDIPAGNPYTGSDSDRCNLTGRTTAGRKCKETFAWGLRNPFRFAFRPGTNEFYINDVGQRTWEEINRGVAGSDYGWNTREGFCKRDYYSTSDCHTQAGGVSGGLTDPIYAYDHTIGNSITGAAFVPTGVWPTPYSGSYLFGDFTGKIMMLESNGSGGYRHSDFALTLGQLIAFRFGPSAGGTSLYYLSYNNKGEVRRIDYTASVNRPPAAVLTANPTYGSAPLAVTFSGAGSSDQDGDSLTYFWNFGDGSSQRTTSTQTTNYTYQQNGIYTARLQVRDARGALSDIEEVVIDVGNTAPVPEITAPSTSRRFRVGETITVSGRATDAEDGTLDGSKLSWRVILHHNDHTHPYLDPTPGSSVQLFTPPPEDVEATVSSFLEIELTATDSRGLSRVITQELRPELVPITFDSNPSGATVIVNSLTFKLPKTITSWTGYVLNVEVPPQSSSGGKPLVFTSWSDGGAASHKITTPSSATTYQVTLVEGQPTATATSSPSTAGVVTGFTLMNAETDQPIAGYNPIPEGAVLNLATLPTRRLNIRANTDPTTVGSVRFALDGNSNYRTETVGPYSLAGDNNGDYQSWLPPLGTHTLIGTPYSGGNASGTAGMATTLNFSVVDNAGASTATNTATALPTATDPAATATRTATRTSAPATATHTATPTSTSAATTAGEVTSFTLMNAVTDQPIPGYESIPEGAVLNLAKLPTQRLNIRVNTSPAIVGSVRFAYDGNANFRTETQAPYAVGGDNNGDYYSWAIAVGSHTLTATPYSGPNATGSVGTARTLTFTVVNNP